MATIETKFSVGDVVFHAGTITEQKSHPCPDCKGARVWKVISPAGGEYETPCPRCASQFMSDRDLSLKYTAHVPHVGRRTIGSVQFNSATGSWDSGARYMCHETGIGSGSVYPEDRLFATEEEAHAAAQVVADEANSTQEWIGKLYDKTLALSDYQLDNATVQLAKDAKSRASYLLWNLSDLWSAIEEAEDKDAILEAIDDYKKYNWERDKANASGTSAGTAETRNEAQGDSPQARPDAQTPTGAAPHDQSQVEAPSPHQSLSHGDTK